jgi:TetR/AcrR family transcriptional regulator, cholesterol catabolism regulator
MTAESREVADDSPFAIASRRQNSKPRPGNDQEQRMINAAAQMFSEKGYDGTSIQDVADKLGLLKGSLYHYIKSKDDLLWAIVLRPHQYALALAQRVRSTEGSASERLTVFVRDYIGTLTKQHIFVSVYLHDINRLSPERRRRITRERTEFTGCVVDILTEGRDAGEFRADLDPVLSSNVILGMMNSTFRWYRPGAKYSSAAITDECLATIFGGIAAAPAG